MRPVGRRFEQDKKEEDLNMSFASRHNKATSNVFTYQQIEDAPFCKVRELYEHGYTEDKKRPIIVRGCFINRGGKYGDSAALVCEGFNVNLPNHMLKEVEEILRSEQDIADINAGTVGAYAYEYTNRNGGKSYSLRWCELGSINSSDLPY